MTALSACAAERQLTTDPAGHLLHNSQVFSPDGNWIVFDSRNDETRLIDSTRIGIVHTTSGEIRTLYQVAHANAHGPGVGAATFSPAAPVTAFIHGPEPATAAAPYAADRRSAVGVHLDRPGKATHLDARDVSAPFTPGALRGGSHAHHWSGDGRWLSFTYNDALIHSAHPEKTDLRSIGVMKTGTPVTVADAKPDLHEFSGSAFACIVVPVTDTPLPGSDQLSRAYEEGWVGSDGYLRADGTRQARALAFLGDLADPSGKIFTEVFIVDLPEDIAESAPAAPLQGTAATLPQPPAGTAVRRLTHSGGIRAPRHWLRGAPDGSTIAFLNQDANGTAQLFGVSPNGGTPRQLSRFTESVDCPFTWSPDGKSIACSAGHCVRQLDVATGEATTLTSLFPDRQHPRHGTVFSPDGTTIAFNRLLPHPDGGEFLQICLVQASAKPLNQPIPSPEPGAGIKRAVTWIPGGEGMRWSLTRIPRTFRDFYGSDLCVCRRIRAQFEKPKLKSNLKSVGIREIRVKVFGGGNHLGRNKKDLNAREYI